MGNLIIYNSIHNRIFEKNPLKQKEAMLNKDINEHKEIINIIQHSDLDELYKNYYPELIASIKSINAFNRNLSYPLLISPFENYRKSKTKIMFVGKETRYWVLDEQNKFLSENIDQNQVVNKLLLNYKHFNYGEKYKKSPFWQFCHTLYKEITLSEDKNGFIWNNLIKVDENGTTPKWDVMKASTAFYKIIQNEIKILKPDVIIFLTGNTLDQYLKYLFPGLEIIPINNELSQVVHTDLPKHSYRTFHPKRHRLMGTFTKVINDIVTEIKKEEQTLV